MTPDDFVHSRMGGAFNKTFKCTFSGNRNLTTAATEKRKKRKKEKKNQYFEASCGSHKFRFFDDVLGAYWFFIVFFWIACRQLVEAWFLWNQVIRMPHARQNQFLVGSDFYIYIFFGTFSWSWDARQRVEFNFLKVLPYMLAPLWCDTFFHF